MMCKIAADDRDKESVQIKLLCGSDVLESFAVPGLWTSEDVSCSRYRISGHSNVGNRLHHCCVMSLLLLVSVNTA